MNYMMDKINLHPNKEKKIEKANQIIEILKECDELDDSEKIMTFELDVAQLNYDLYKISGDNEYVVSSFYFF